MPDRASGRDAATSPAFDLVGALPAIVWEADAPGGHMTFVSPRTREMLGHDPAAWVADPGFWLDHVHIDDLDDALEGGDEAMRTGQPARVEYRFRTADGEWRWLSDSIQVLAREDGTPRLVGVMVDITDQRSHVEDLEAVRSGRSTGSVPDRALTSPLHQSIVDNLSDGVYYVDRERCIRYWNHGAERITGYRAADVLGRHCYDNILCHVDAEGRNVCRGGCPLQRTMRDGQERQVIVWLQHADGHRVPVETRTAPIHAGDPDHVVGGVEIFSDATGLIEARDEADRARHDALTDPLTGLPNRRLLDAVLASRRDEMDRHQVPFGFLMVDVDHFKRFNDEHGHDVGDQALRIVARSLQGALRSGDTLVRWGGEEFAVVASHVTDDGIGRLAERLLRMIRATHVNVPSGSVPIRVSIGGAIALPGQSLDQLFVRADQALLAAKASGRDRFVLEGPAAADVTTAPATDPGSPAPR